MREEGREITDMGVAICRGRWWCVFLIRDVRILGRAEESWERREWVGGEVLGVVRGLEVQWGGGRWL